jgi:chorismate-pyruvate lyase
VKNESKTKYAYDPLHGFLSQEEVSIIPFNDISFEDMDPFLRVLLVTDGTVTKFLEAYLWEPISVERCLQEETILQQDEPLLGVKKGESAILRRILLRGVESGRVYTFAESLIRIHLLEPYIQKDLLEGRLGIGELLRDRRLETYREILKFGKEKAGQELAVHFKIKNDDPVYYRRYRITIKGLPVILITERFFEGHFRMRGNR